jgi:hypothetical protein
MIIFNIGCVYLALALFSYVGIWKFDTEAFDGLMDNVPAVFLIFASLPGVMLIELSLSPFSRNDRDIIVIGFL